MEDLVIESSKFPAAQPPNPNLPSKIETEFWPCPPSLAVIGMTHTHFHAILFSHLLASFPHVLPSSPLCRAGDEEEEG